jgi:hypothetical protein
MKKESKSIRSLKSLREHLQAALEVEHSTIPPYLTAWLSIEPGTNLEAAGILRSVLLEEMLHVTQVANLLNAVGGAPSLTRPGFVPVYPHTLPYSGDRFKISVEKFSRKALNTFLKIELPEKKGAKAQADNFKTLGQFYKAIEEGIHYLCKRLGKDQVFSGDRALQIPPEAFYGTGMLTVVKDMKTAHDAIREIATEGEGCESGVFDLDKNIAGREYGREPAHYYRFLQILKGRYFQKGDTPRTGPRGPKLAVDFSKVYPIRGNTRLDDYPARSPVRAALEAFSETYGQLLGALEDAFNGRQARLNDAIATMFALENQAAALMRMPAAQEGATVGLCFEQAASARASTTAATDAAIDRAIAAHPEAFRKPGVLSVRPGWKIKGGWPTSQRAIVAIVENKRPDVPAAAKVPAVVGGYPTDVRQATPKQLARVHNPELLARWKASEREHDREPVFVRERDAQTLKPLTETAATPAFHSTRGAAYKQNVPYTPAPGVPLDAVTGNMSLLCQVSPDAGWAALKAFLSGIQETLTVGMYDFTSAHVLQTLEAGMGQPRELSLVLDHPSLNPTANQTDEETCKDLTADLRKRLQFAWAASGFDPMVTGEIFPSSYHIKVAVRDHASFWLSSGNWNNSNQPDVNVFAGGDKTATNAILADSDRDWHIIVDHDGLAQTFEAYLKHDLQVAAKLQNHKPLTQAEDLHNPQPQGEARIPKQYFQAKQFDNVTVKIQPLLTPDQGAGNYASNILDLINSAQKTLYVQTQYLQTADAGDPKAAPFRAIADAIVAKIGAGLDVRLIFSQYETEQWLEKLQSVGIPASVVRIQNNVHNKGIVVDSSVVVLGSQNWSEDGALFNRDASLIIFDAAVAQYYEQVFLHDWENMAVQKAPTFEAPATAVAASGRKAAAARA